MKDSVFAIVANRHNVEYKRALPRDCYDGNHTGVIVVHSRPIGESLEQECKRLTKQNAAIARAERRARRAAELAAREPRDPRAPRVSRAKNGTRVGLLVVKAGAHILEHEQVTPDNLPTVADFG